MKYRKWIGGGLGWVLGGPLGALLGYFLGSAFDKASTMADAGQSRKGYGGPSFQRPQHTTSRGDFMACIVVLTGAVMKADGRVTQAELDYVKRFFVQQFGVETASDGILMLRDVLKKDIPVQEVSRQIGRQLDRASKLQLLHYLFGISNADGQIHPNELNVIADIAGNMGVSATDYNSVKSMFIKESPTSAYTILGITPDATDDEVKKAYRRMAVANHPDKVAYLGEDVQKSAKEKFQKINDAYESIKKERGMI